MKIDCKCGYKYYYDFDSGKWCIKGSTYNMEPKKVSDDLDLWACPECGSVYHNV